MAKNDSGFTYIEADPLPECCIGCKEDCYNCDEAGERWQLSPKDEYKKLIKYKITYIKYLQRQIAELQEDNAKEKHNKRIAVLEEYIRAAKIDIVEYTKAIDEIEAEEG